MTKKEKLHFAFKLRTLPLTAEERKRIARALFQTVIPKEEWKMWFQAATEGLPALRKMAKGKIDRKGVGVDGEFAQVRRGAGRLR